MIFQTKIRTIQAIRYTGENQEEIWTKFGVAGIYGLTETNPDHLLLTTVSGDPVPCRAGDWIIQDGKPNTFYPCTDLEFKARYEDPSLINHAWPRDGEHLFNSWQTYKGMPNATQYRSCIHPDCQKVEHRDAPKG